MPDNFVVQSNVPEDLNIVTAPPLSVDDLLYTTGGGVIFGGSLQDDAIQGGKQAHVGNPPIPVNQEPIYKKCGKVDLVKETITVKSASITRGLFTYRQTVSNPTNDSKTNGNYYWDEVYTSPVGIQEAILTGSAQSQFSLTGNQLVIRTNDVNIVPKVGDYIIFQRINAEQLANLPSNVTDSNASFTDGFSNLPVLYNTETYQFKIQTVSFTSPSGTATEYTIVLDKSMATTIGDSYSIVLLNRENTGLQKELFYDTFEQVEVNRSQLLGDPYFNMSSVSPAGRKNYLNYNSAQYLGLRNLLGGIINVKNQELIETAFIVYDVTAQLKDRFLPEVSIPSAINFEFELPLVMIQEDTGNNLNILTNYGLVQNDTAGAGRYSGLYLKWGSNTGKRYGFIFYDLRIIVIDDSELVSALSYNSNRNYTLPEMMFNSQGNSVANPISNLNLDIIGIDNNSTGGTVIVIINGNHGLSNATAVTITNVNVTIPGTNQIQPASANGVRYIKRYYNDPINSLGERTDRFYIYQDSSLTSGITGNGQFINNGIGNSGEVKGAKLTFDYFFTYRPKNVSYNSVLPYTVIKSFNFSSSLNESVVDNNIGSLFLNLPALTYYDHADGGYPVNDLEFIIGQWDASDPSQPFQITGIKNTVVISINELVTNMPPSNTLATDYVISKQIYNNSLARMGNSAGPFNYFSNPTGDPTYDLFNNMLHYNITSGTLSTTLNTAEGKWTLGNVTYQTEIDQFRSSLVIAVKASEWNDTTNPSYDSANSFIDGKYISEIAICSSDSDTPLVFAKISPPVKKTSDLDLSIVLSLDF